MARLGQWGGELGDTTAEGVTTGGTAPSYDTAVKRTGTRSYKLAAGAAGTGYTQVAFTGAVDTTYYAVQHIFIPTGGFSSTSAGIMGFYTGAGTALCRVDLSSAQKLGLLNSGFSLVGSLSATTLVVETWYRVELVCQVVGGANDDTLELYLDGTLVASSTTQSIGTTAPGQLRFGITNHTGTGMTMQWDDIALNDSTGSVNNTLVGNQKIYALFPASDNARGNWTAGGAGTTNLWEAVNNTPPVGILPAAGVGATVQIQNNINSANAHGDFNLTDYTTAGVGSGDTVTAVQTIVAVGNSSTTGTDAISTAMVSNPAIATTGEISADIVSGTYPASWNRGVGTMTENPSVTLGTQPVMRITKVDGSTRFNACCLMVLVVGVSPGAPAAPSFNYRPLRSMTRLRR
jgi:hypothetical protein